MKTPSDPLELHDALSAPGGVTRRAFMASSASAILAGYAMLHWPGQARASSDSLPQAGGLTHLDASRPQGIDLHIRREMISIGGGRGDALTINHQLPAPVIHMREGQEILIRVHNHMDEYTSIHWHGVLVPFNMDGVPKLSFEDEGIAPGETFTYRYRVIQKGTYWYHSHSGLQLQKGTYGMLIIHPQEPDPFAYDTEQPIILSDWTFEDPRRILSNLKKIEGYYNFQRPTLANLPADAKMADKSILQMIGQRLKWQQMRMDPTDIADVTGQVYRYLLNGRTGAQNFTTLAQPGQRVRLRIVNASANTYFDFRIPGLAMTVVQADGQNIQPVETDELRLAVAETYDVIVTLPEDQPRTMFAEAMDRSGSVHGTLATEEGQRAAVPRPRRRPLRTMADMGMMHAMQGKHDADMHKENASHDMHDDHASHDMASDDKLPGRIKHGPAEHGPKSITMAQSVYRRVEEPGAGLGDDGWRVLTYSQLRCQETPPFRREPDRSFDLHLTGNMHKFIWGFDGKSYHESDKILMVYGERLRINMINDTMMAHPIHIHGMFMDLHAGGDLNTNPRKHTVNVKPAELLTVDITVDAPGLWAFHCHLLYHMEAGMFRTVAVVRSLDEATSHEEGGRR